MIGILGGTFDPVHIGHLRVALELYQDLSMDEIRFVPCFQPPHRSTPQATVKQRVTMLEMAIKDQQGFVLDRRELEREGPSYMVETLRSFRVEFAATPLCLIIGMDAFKSLHTWWHWQELIKLAHIIVMHRPGYKPACDGDVAALLGSCRIDDFQALRQSPAGLLLFRPVTQLDIAASQIRAQVATEKSARYLLNEDVWAYICKEGLYR